MSVDRINELRARAAELLDGLLSGDLAGQAVEASEAEITAMNTRDQLYERGVNSLGVKIADYAPYSDFTAAMKEAAGQPHDRVTLRDTGDFHRSFRVEAGPRQFRIAAADPKAGRLKRKYGARVIGLTADNRDILAWEHIYPHMMEEARRLLLWA